MKKQVPQSLTEMSTRNISWGGGKGGRCLWLTTLPPSCGDCLEVGRHNILEPSGPVHVCNGTALPLPLPSKRYAKCPVSGPPSL